MMIYIPNSCYPRTDSLRVLQWAFVGELRMILLLMGLDLSSLDDCERAFLRAYRER